MAGIGDPGRPAGGGQHGDEGGHLDERFGRAEQAECSAHERAGRSDDRRSVADRATRARRFAAERECREHVGSDVEGEHLQDADREREAPAGKRPDHERGELGDIVGEVVGEEAADVA